MGAADRAFADEQISHSIRALDLYESAEQVVGYVALRDEVNLERLLLGACEAGKRVYLPVVAAQRELRFARWSPGDPLQRSEVGVPEPTSMDQPAVAATVSLVPGRAFDPACNRVGRGGGYYDRAMAVLDGLGATIGVAYSCQIFDTVPVEGFDRAVGLLVTDASLYRAGAG
jgi:5-formyltetrahydrofolate cyclo-ligase